MKLITSPYQKLILVTSYLQPVLLLALRVYFGYQLAQTGWTHLHNLDKVTEYFTSLNIPMPHANAVISGATEFVAGVLWIFGLGTRLISIPTFFNFCVAYWMASRDELMNFWSKPDGFIKDDAFVFWLTSLILIAIGPGLFSLDAIIKKFTFPKSAKVAAT